MLAVAACAMIAQAQQAQPTDAAAELAKKLANPVAALISVPLQYNEDGNLGPNDDGSKSVLNVQPVTPFSLTQDWNLIVRTIVPLIDQHDLPEKGQDQSGMGDVVQSFFFSPKVPVGGWILAAGPVGLYPTASDDMLGGEKWGAGPTVLALQQGGPWTYGVLGNHIWSVAGQDERADISLSFVQPFLSYITKTKTTLGVNTESTYDWENSAWAVPVNVTVAQLLKIGPQIFQVTLGARYWAESPESGPEGWGARAGLTFLFPK
ncbi:MAG: transporter [Lentisphaerae bacterium]|nr:transporter [Lentisphaerota bacterium]